MTQCCPVCECELRPNPRYPDHLCRDCAAKAVAPDGRALKFGNVSFSGGFIAHFADTGEVHDSNLCFVEGVQCWAKGAYFGGIVVRPTRSGKRPRDGVLGT